MGVVLLSFSSSLGVSFLSASSSRSCCQCSDAVLLEQHSEKLAGSEFAFDACCLQHIADVCFYFNGLTSKAPAKKQTSSCGEKELRGLVELPGTQHDRALRGRQARAANCTTATVKIRGRFRAQQDKMHVADLELPRLMTRSVIELARLMYSVLGTSNSRV